MADDLDRLTSKEMKIMIRTLILTLAKKEQLLKELTTISMKMQKIFEEVYH